MPQNIAQHHILVDYENTQQLDLQRISGEPVKLVIFLGHNQKDRIPYATVTQLLTMAPQVELVAAAGSGRNALDFMVAFHAGRIIERNPNAVIHILSKDKGFDPLIRHLNESGRSANRYDSFSAIPVAGIQKAIRTNPERKKPENAPTANPSPTNRTSRSRQKATVDATAKHSKPALRETHEAPPSDAIPAEDPRIQRTIDWLTKLQPQSRPRKNKTLGSAIRSIFNGKPSMDEIQAILNALSRSGKIRVDDKQSVSYNL